MSSISAGTTSGTALVSSGDTTGELVLKTNGSTTAVTIGTNQVVTLAQPLPVASGGTGSTTGLNLSTAVTGTLPVGNGGTGASTLAANNVLLGNGTSAVQTVAPGTAGNVLTSNGTTWQSTAPAATAGSITATASGSLTAGAPVVVNSNGTVSVGAATYSGTWTVNTSASNATVTGNLQMSATYDPNANAVVVYYGNSSGYPTVIVGMISGTTITWGTPVVVYSGATVAANAAAKSIYASTANAHMYFHNYSDGYWRYSSVRISSTGSVSIIQAANYVDYFPTVSNNYRVSFLYDPGTNRLALFFPSTSGNISYLLGGYCDTSGYFYYAYSTVVDSGGTSTGPCAAYMDNGVGVLFWQNDSYYLWTRTATLSNSSASLGSTVQVTSWNNNQYSITVGPQAGGGGLLYAYIPSGGSAMQFRAATRSGTTITLGSISASASYGFYNYYYSQFLTYGGRTIWVNNSLVYDVTVSGGVPTATYIGTSSSRNGEPQNFISNTSDLNLLQISYSSSIATQASFYSDVTSSVTSTNFIGFSSGTYSNGQTATINTVGSTDSSQSGLTAGLKYYVTIAGALSSSATSQPYAGVALSATKILIKG